MDNVFGLLPAMLWIISGYGGAYLLRRNGWYGANREGQDISMQRQGMSYGVIMPISRRVARLILPLLLGPMLLIAALVLSPHE